MLVRRPMDTPAKDWISGNLAAEVSQRARVDADGGSVGDQESSTLDRLEESEENSETSAERCDNVENPGNVHQRYRVSQAARVA